MLKTDGQKNQTTFDQKGHLRSRLSELKNFLINKHTSTHTHLWYTHTHRLGYTWTHTQVYLRNAHRCTHGFIQIYILESHTQIFSWIQMYILDTHRYILDTQTYTCTYGTQTSAIFNSFSTTTDIQMRYGVAPFSEIVSCTHCFLHCCGTLIYTFKLFITFPSPNNNQ